MMILPTFLKKLHATLDLHVYLLELQSLSPSYKTQACRFITVPPIPYAVPHLCT